MKMLEQRFGRCCFSWINDTFIKSWIHQGVAHGICHCHSGTTSSAILRLHAFLQATLISNARLKLAKNQAKANQYTETGLSLFKNYSLSSSILSSKNNRRYFKGTKNKYACLNEVIYFITMKMRLKIKKVDHIHTI